MNVFELEASISINLDNFNSGLDHAKNKFESFGKNLKGISDNMGKAYDGLGDLLKPAVDGFKAVEGVGKKAGSVVMNGLKGFAAAATAVGGFGTAAVKSGAQFDAAMSEVSAISGATGQDFDALRDKALAMGAKTKFSASEAAAAMTYMGMAGWKAGDMISGIEGIMNLAAASGEDLATTSDIVTDALTAFGLSAGDSGHFANVMAVAASNANTNVGLMGETFKYVAPVAGALGYSVDDTALAIGLMANSGIKATQAGTALRSIFTRLSTDAGSSSKQLGALGVLTEKLGVEFYNTDGSARNLNDVLLDSRSAWAGLSEEQQIAYAKTIAGQEAMSGWLALMNAAPSDVDKLTAALEDCNGAAEKMSATMIDNLQGDVTLVKSAFESLQIAISDSLTPTLREFAQFGQKAMQNLLEGFQGSGVSGFMSALSGVVTDGVSMLSGKAPEFARVSTQFVMSLANGILDGKDQIISSARETISVIVDGFDEWLNVNSADLSDFGLDIVGTIFDGFSKAGDLISEHVGEFVPLIAEAFLSYHESLFTVGLDILGAIGQGIIDNKEELQQMASKTITNMVTALSENAPAIIEGGIALLEALAKGIVDNLPLIMATGAQIVGELIAGISTSLPALAVAAGAIIPHIAKIIDVVGSIGKAVSGVVRLVSGGIGTIMSIGKTLTGGIQALFGLIAANPVAAIITGIIGAVVLLYTKCEWFRDAVHTVIDAVAGFFQGAWDLIKSAWESAGEFFGGIVDGIRSAFEGIGEFLGSVFKGAWEAVKSAWEGAKSFFSDIWEGIKGVFSSVADVLGGFFSAAADAVQAAWDGVSEFFSGVWEGIQSVFSNVADVLGGFFRDAWSAVQGAWEAAKDFFVGIADGIHSAFDTVTQFLGDAFSSAWEAVQGAWNTAVSFFQDVWDGISGAFESVAEWFGDKFSAARDAVEAAWDNITGFFSDVWQGICDVFGDVWDKFKEIGGNMLKGLWEGVTGAFGWVKEKLGGVVDGIVGIFTGKDGFDTHSPSRVFADIGKNVMLGLGNGVKGENGTIDSQMAQVVGTMKDAFSGLAGVFANIGQNAMSALSGSLGGAINSLKSKVSSLMQSIASAASAALGIHSPSKVFANIGKNMALGLEEGWDNEYSGIKKQIESGMNFETANIGVSSSLSGNSQRQAHSDGMQNSGAFGNTYVTINSPKAVDPVEAARVWRKETQKMALGLI